MVRSLVRSHYQLDAIHVQRLLERGFSLAPLKRRRLIGTRNRQISAEIYFEFTLACEGCAGTDTNDNETDA